MPAEIKECRKCHLLKRASDFYKDKRRLDGLRSYCKVCMFPPEVQEAARKRASNWYYALAQNTRKFLIFQRRLWQRYRVTPEWYVSKLQEQGGHCALCPIMFDGVRRLGIDHDHNCCPGRNSCGKCVRGLLCSRCNVLVSYFERPLDDYNRVSFYLHKYAAKVVA